MADIVVKRAKKKKTQTRASIGTTAPFRTIAPHDLSLTDGEIRSPLVVMGMLSVSLPLLLWPCWFLFLQLELTYGSKGTVRDHVLGLIKRTDGPDESCRGAVQPDGPWYVPSVSKGERWGNVRTGDDGQT